MRYALAVGASCGVIVAALVALLANAYRCIDTPVFYNPSVLVASAIATSAVAAGSVLLGSRRMRLGLPFLIAGLAVLAYAIVAPPYRACGQFFVPM